MEVIAAVVGSVISTLCTQNCLCGSLSQQCNYLRKHQEKSKELKDNLEGLWDQANRIKRKLDLAKLQEGKEPQAEVVRWLGKVERIKDEVDSLMETVGERKQCLYGCFPNCHSRLKTGKHIEEKTNMVNKLRGQGQFPDDQLTELQLEKGKPLPTTTLVGKTTAERNFEQIWDSIFDNSVSRIGVYGMGGVGKTTIMQNIHNRLLKGGTGFDHIIWITVSKESNLEKLQNHIGKKLDLDLRDHEDILSRASILLEALERRKRFILILDDMWEAFPLDNVGIPNPTRENGCKLLLTTRLQGVCRRMETERNVEVRVLSEDEAWDLFKQKVGEDVLHSSDIQALAKDVAKECDGLPLALITVGRALRQVDDVMEWKNALNELRTSVADIEGFQDEVFKSLRFSYSRLKDDKIRDCFLYCALYPEDEEVSVEELIEHWIGEGFINDLERREDQICKGKTILNELKYASMLEEGHYYYRGENREVVKMHDLVRDLAISIQSPTCMIKAGLRLTKVPRDAEWMESLERVSLIGNELKELMGEPKCPKLTSLLLHDNSHLRDISLRFFQQMNNLRVINLSSTDIEFLPKSLVELKNLRVLLLQECRKLKKLPSVANLKSLGTLDLSFTSVTELPPGMEMLVNLRRLDLWNCHLKMFPANLLQKLTHLEDLSVEFSGGEEPEGEKAEESKGEETEEEPDGEEPEGEKAEESKGEETVEVEEADGEEGEESKGEETEEEPDGEGEETDEEEAELTPFLEELINNTHLRSLHVNFRNSKNFNSYIGSGHWRQLASFSIVSHPRSEPKLAGKNHISIEGGGTLLVLPETTHQLDMRNCDTITRLSMCLPKSPQLQKCTLQGCNDMECIVMAGENSLPSLQRMVLKGLPKLSSLCKGVVAPGTLSSLKELKVVACGNLKNVLTRGLLQHLQSLEEIFVKRCSEMEEIIVGIMGEEDGDEKEKGEAGMMSGGGNKNEGNNNNNNNNSIITLPSPTSLPGHNNYLPSLQRMHLRGLPKLRSLCKGVVAPGTFSSLKVLTLHDCNNMKNLLTRGLLQHLQSLEEIDVWGCKGMEEIIGGEGEEDDKERGGEEGIISSGTINNNAIITAILPRLWRLVLYRLPELKSICSSSRGVMVCNSLQHIRVDECRKLKKLGIVSMEENDNNGGRTLMGAPPGVKKIIGNNKKWWDPQTSDHPDAHTFLQPFITRV